MASSRSQPLDVLRGFAVILVFGRHAFEPTPKLLARAPTALLWWRRIGWCGVDLFFVLSGFLIGGLLIRELAETGTIRVGRFLVRRGFRIYPLFYLLLALSAVLPMGANGHMVLREALFLQDYTPHAARIWDHTWSLAVEEQFYLLIPLALLAAARSGRLPVLDRIALMTALGVLPLRVATTIARPRFSNDVHLFPLHLRLDALLVGVALAALSAREPRRIGEWLKERRIPLLFLAACLLAPVAIWPIENPWMHTIGLSALALGCALLVALAAHAARPTIWLVPLALVGQASYGIYLFHAPVRRVIEHELSAGAAAAWPVFALYVGLSIAVGLLLHRLVERPCIRLRDRLLPEGSRAISDPQGRGPVAA